MTRACKPAILQFGARARMQGWVMVANKVVCARCAIACMHVRLLPIACMPLFTGG
jgi:hypothetical protein